MENKAFRPFSEIEMTPIIEEFKKEEYHSGLTKKQVLVEGNLIYIVDMRQQYVEVHVEGMGRMDYYDEDTYITQNVIAYCYFKNNLADINISPDVLRTQIIIRIFISKLHIGIKPGVEFSVSLNHSIGKTDCVLQIKYYGNIYCPHIKYFTNNLDLFESIINDSIINPNLTLKLENVNAFLNDAEEKGLYEDEEQEQEENVHNNYRNDDLDEWETEYRRQSIEERGYDDYDMMYGNDHYEEKEPDYDEEYCLERAKCKYEQKVNSYFQFANLNPYYYSGEY